MVTATLTVSLSIIGLTSCDKDNNPLKSTTYSFSSDEFADLYNLTRKMVIKGSIEDRDNTHFTFGVKRNPSATTIINGVEYPISIVF